ncbi:membrane protein [Bacillus subtilis subsp. subtilis str. OH 131.1]|nr:membrane protein [Bacillus subtilis subsp. subtilis str. OH 131.1]
MKQEQTHNGKAGADSIGLLYLLGAFVYASCFSAFLIAM